MKNYIYRIKGFRLEKKIKKWLEEEINTTLRQLRFQTKELTVHLNLEKFKNNDYSFRIEFWLVELKKNILATGQENNIYTVINQVIDRIKIQTKKIKEKKQR